MKQRDEVLERVRAPGVVRQGTVTEAPPGEIWARPGDGVGALCTRIRDALDDHLFVDVACMGATATNNGVKAVAELRRAWGDSHPANSDVFCQPFFSSFVNEAGEERTRLVLRVFVKML